MARCPNCGGIIGRDCFNPIECGWITQQMNAQYAVDDYIREQQAKAEWEHYETIQRDYYNQIQEEHNQITTEQILSSNSILKRFLKNS